MKTNSKEDVNFSSVNIKPRVSIIIPSYNCGLYIKRAVDSVLSQDLGDIEIIIVNDASTDNTLDILNKAYAQNEIIKVITHEHNMMLGASRNTGLNAAMGKYIFFLDADDWIDNNTLKHLLLTAEENNVEIVACGARKVFEDGRKEFYHGHSFICGGGNDALLYFSKHQIGSIVWNKLYLREFIEKNKLFFITKYWFEDVIFTLQAVFACTKYISISDVYCNYFQRKESYVNSKPVLLNLQSTINVYLEMLKFFKNHNLCNDSRGRFLCGSLLKSHCSGDIFPKILAYIKAYPGEVWREDLLRVCQDMLGVDGYAIADFLIYSLDKINNLNLEKIELDSVLDTLDTTKSQLDTTKSQLDTTKSQLDSRVNELNTIYYSRGWRFLVYLRKMMSSFIPRESVRRKIVSFLYNYSKKCIKSILKTKGKILGVFSLLKNYLNKPRIYKRKINRNSKKIVYVGHSYHKKTKSTTFLIEYLKEYYDVEEVLDESWLGKSFPNLSFIDESYLGVIFFQLLPPKDVIKTIRNDNIIIFPMFDYSKGFDYGYWNDYKAFKIINFSRNLHNRLHSWDFESIYLQYFPKPVNFTPGRNKEIFFWQRLTHFNISTVVKLFKGTGFKIHLHKVVDPGQEFIPPSKEMEKRFKINYSDWFETKDEMLDVIKQKGIYVAPREYEGIGMSFLEAMAMGKAVVAVNNPTMNEYIENGVNGYLFDLKNPKEIDLSNIEQIQKNSYEFMKEGYRKWERDKSKIIIFINKD